MNEKASVVKRTEANIGISVRQLLVPSKLYTWKRKKDQSVTVVLSAAVYDLVARECAISTNTRIIELKTDRGLARVRTDAGYKNTHGEVITEVLETVKDLQSEIEETIAHWEKIGPGSILRWQKERDGSGERNHYYLDTQTSDGVTTKEFDYQDVLWVDRKPYQKMVLDNAAKHFKLVDPHTGAGYYELPIEAFEEIHRNYSSKRRHLPATACTICRRNLLKKISGIPQILLFSPDEAKLIDFDKQIVIPVFTPSGLNTVQDPDEARILMNMAEYRDEKEAISVEIEDEPKNSHENVEKGKPESIETNNEPKVLCPVCEKPMIDKRNGQEHAPEKVADFICSDPKCKYSWDKEKRVYVPGKYVTSRFRWNPLYEVAAEAVQNEIPY